MRGLEDGFIAVLKVVKSVAGNTTLGAVFVFYQIQRMTILKIA